MRITHSAPTMQSRRKPLLLGLALALVLLPGLASAGAVTGMPSRPAVAPPAAGYRLRLPFVVRQDPPPTPTPTATPTATATSLPSATPAPTSTATLAPPTPPPPSGENVVCNQTGAAEICAWVSKADLAQNSTETVYGRLVINGIAQAGRTMSTTWHYKTTTSSCSGTTWSDGVASCSRNIGRATLGYQVNVDVVIDGYTATTWFVAQ